MADAAGLEKFALLGISQGASVAIEYAVRHPERVTHLVIHGGFVRGWLNRGPASERAGRAWVELVRVGWGTSRTNVYYRMFAELFIPGATDEQLDWFAELQRRSTKPELAARIMEASGQIDIVDPLAQVKAADAGDASAGRCDRALRTGSRDRRRDSPTPSSSSSIRGNHLLLEAEPAWQKFREVVGEFLGWPSAAPLRRAADRPADSDDLAALTGP